MNPTTAEAITLLLVLIKRCLVSGRKEYQCNCVVLPALLSEFHECCFFKDKAIHRCANILQQSWIPSTIINLMLLNSSHTKRVAHYRVMACFGQKQCIYSTNSKSFSNLIFRKKKSMQVKETFKLLLKICWT